MMTNFWAKEAFDKLINEYEFNSVLDIGSGQGLHAEAFRKAGKEVTEHRFEEFGPYMGFCVSKVFDAVWCSHVLEHTPEPRLFLYNIYKDLKDDGILAITVPPAKHQIVGGHVSLWNAGCLLYNLILSGFDCSGARVKQYGNTKFNPDGYNISVIVRKKSFEMPELAYDSGDIYKLREFFPKSLNLTGDSFNGDIKELNWE